MTIAPRSSKKWPRMLLALGVVAKLACFSSWGVWGLFSLGEVSGGNSGEELLGGTSGGWGLGSLRRTRGKGNYWKEVDPETAVCRLRNATARQGETAPPCGCRNGGLETAAPC